MALTQKDLDRIAAFRAKWAAQSTPPKFDGSGRSADAYIPRPLWSVQTADGEVWRHGVTADEARAAAERCGLTITPNTEIVKCG